MFWKVVPDDNTFNLIYVYLSEYFKKYKIDFVCSVHISDWKSLKMNSNSVALFFECFIKYFYAIVLTFTIGDYQSNPHFFYTFAIFFDVFTLTILLIFFAYFNSIIVSKNSASFLLVVSFANVANLIVIFSDDSI